MNNTVFLPKRINVGYQKRKDTYTGSLAYIIYWDAKGKLRKETSWESWRDKKIKATEFENTPTEGFVLNKKVGGDNWSGWNPRQTYSRVYDPRGFEFEITVPNLLYILENANSIKGKGLEGKFVYGWDGTELLLIPECAPEYNQLQEFSELLEGKEQVKSKDLVLGGTYLTNKNTEVIYLGKFDYYGYSWKVGSDSNKGKHHFFQDGKYLLTLKSLSNRIIRTVSTDPVANYAELMDKLECNTSYSPYDPSKDKYLPVTEKMAPKTTLYFTFDGKKFSTSLTKGEGENYTFSYWIKEIETNGHSWGYTSPAMKRLEAQLTELGHDIRGKGVPLKKLLDTYNFTHKKEFLANGKEKK